MTRAGVPIALNARYFDALALLAERAGTLVTKDDFMARVWHGIPVTDEALTQCVRSLRRTLDDDAAAPRYIATVPKHGYRFIAEIDRGAERDAAPSASPTLNGAVVRSASAGGLGGGIAGLIGGVCYGLVSAAAGEANALSVVLVLTMVTAALAATGGAMVGVGVALAERVHRRPSPASVVGGMSGGLAIGVAVRLLGSDALAILLARRPGEMTGGFEGAILGAAVGAAIWLVQGGKSWWPIVARAATGAFAGGAIAMLGGRLMGGSLAALHAQIPGAASGILRVGQLFGEAGFGPLTVFVTSVAEAALFVLCVSTALRPLGPTGA